MDSKTQTISEEAREVMISHRDIIIHRHSTRWTDEQESMFLEMYRRHFPTTIIAAKFDMKTSSVYHMAQFLRIKARSRAKGGE